MSRTEELNVLVVGSGGREHALARAIAADPQVAEVHVAPGNPGTAQFATNHPVDILNGAAVATLATGLGCNLVVVGPEAPLVAGVADAVREAGIACFGPSEAAAQLEGSKAFAKDIMDRAGVPTAAARLCTTLDEAAAALQAFGAPYVVKNDGLAAGKGVVVTDDYDAALAHAKACGRVVIEDYLDGPEVSLFVITDGTTAVPLLPAQDFKRVGEGDVGLNTGGMGSYCPLPWAPATLTEQVMAQVVTPTLATMRDRGTPFVGLLYVGLALGSRGARVVEFNARFGDPETEVILPLLTSPLGQVLYAAATGTLADCPPLEWQRGACVGVVLASAGYPSAPRTGGLVKLPADTKRAHIIHAGTARNEAGRLIADGGRVLVVVGLGDDVGSAQQNAYGLVDKVDFPTGFCRRDIAAAERLRKLAAWNPQEAR